MFSKSLDSTDEKKPESERNFFKGSVVEKNWDNAPFPLNLMPIKSTIPQSYGLEPYVLKGEKLMLIPLRPEHQGQLYTEIFSQAHVMQYIASGQAVSHDRFAQKHLERLNQNILSSYRSGRLSHYTWTILTVDGIAGRLIIFPTQGRTELGYCISPAQQGKALARRASELVVEYLGEETPLIARAHPKNQASLKTLESIRHAEGKFVFFRDITRQNAPGTYGPEQSRDYFLSKDRSIISFFSFYKEQNILVDLSNDSENSTRYN